MEKVKKLNAKRKKELASGKTLYTTVQTGMEKTSKAEQEGARHLLILKRRLKQSEERVLTLKQEILNCK